jgi:hypothetical protein
MKFLKSLLMGTGAVVLAGLVLALLAPKAVHAVVATAVQVVNTSANPAITEDTSRQASQIVTLTCHFSLVCYSTLPNLNAPDSGPNGGYLVPANEYFVVKSIDAFNIGASTPISIRFIVHNGGGTSDIAVEQVVLPPNGQISFASGLAVVGGAEVVTSASTPLPTGGILTIHGYLTPN